MCNRLIHFLIVFILLSILWITVKTNNFCDSFVENDNKMIVLSDEKMLIIGDKYWTLNVSNRELRIVDEDRVPNNSSLLNNDYLYAFNSMFSNISSRSEWFGKVFYNVMNMFFNL